MDVWNKYVTFVVFNYKALFMKYSEFYRLIEANGWTIISGKKHYKYVHPDFDYFIPVARHPAKEMPKGTLHQMMKAAGLKDSESKKKNS